MDKFAIRKAMKAKKLALEESVKKEAAGRVFAQLEQWKPFIVAKKILAYHSLPDELGTASFLERWESEKQLFLPRVNGEELEILPYQSGCVKEGAFHIQEPLGGGSVPVGEMDLVIVPAVAFDHKGMRLGRGKGYYDRLLIDARCPKVGVGYDFQLLDSLPAEPHDIPMDFIVTETHFLRLGNDGQCSR